MEIKIENYGNSKLKIMEIETVWILDNKNL